MFENNMHIFVLLLVFSCVVIYKLSDISYKMYLIIKNQKFIYNEVSKWKNTKKIYYNKNKKT